jgi:putative ABC transport system permease protein
MQIPPRFAEALLRLFLSSEDAEAIGGDLEETFRTTVVPRAGIRAARFWYWRQTFSIITAHVLTPVAGPSYSPPTRTTMAAIRQDLSYAFRSLAKQPGFTAMAVLMLAIGIGANVAIFSLVNAVLLKPLPFADPARLMMVHLLVPDWEAPGVLRQMIWSYPKYQVFREHQRAFESAAVFGAANWNLTGSGSPERVVGEHVESSYFDTLGLKPVLGRTFSAEETRAPGSAPLAVLGHGFWVRRFGADPGVLGRTVGLNGVAHTIVGVAPPPFRGLTGEAEVWVPITTLSPAALGEAWNHSYQVVARLNADTSVETAQAEVTVLGRRIYEQIPDPFPRDGGPGKGIWGATAVPLDDQRIDPLIRRSILLLLAAVASVLLIVCVNLANLMLVRGLAREREVAIRLALGASRLRIVRQLMTESAVLAVAGSVAGLAVAYAAMSAGATLTPDLRMVLPREGPTGGLTRVGLGLVGLDGTMLLFTIGIAIGAAVLFGLGPAWRTSRRDLTATMKAGSSGAVSQGTRGFALRNLLIVGEIALALVLLTAGGLMLKSIARLQATEVGFNPDSLLAVRVALPAPQYNPQRATQFLDQLVGRVAGHAEIDAVAYGSCAPVSGGCNGTIATFPDRPPAPPGARPMVGVLWASPRYFETLGTRLIRGRVFTDSDRAGQPKVVVINEAAARAFWGSEEPIGKRIGVGQGGFHDGAEVVGVVADVRYGTVERSVRPDVYLPLLQSARSMGLIFVRSRTSTDSLVQSLRRDVQALDPDLPLTDVKTMEQRFDDATWRTRMSAWLLSVFAALALFLAAMGLYGVMSQGVEQRRRELGVRMALGATRSDIMRLIIGRVFVLAVTGTVAGVVLAVPAMRLLTALLYQVKPTDPVVFTLLALALVAVAVLAGYVPARRATRVDPLVTLRAD